MSEIKFKVFALRTINSPYRREDQDEVTHETIYYLLVDMNELPDNIPMDVNPRQPKMNTSIARSLLNAVIEPETDFYINNRGIVIAAKALMFNNVTSEVTIDIGNQEDGVDKYSYGILDGGHTYTAIMMKRGELSRDIKKYVRIEVITNVHNITRLSDARNTSLQVSDIALFNLDDKFEEIKSIVKDQPYADKIAYKDNEDKPIHISELLRLIYAFDIDKYPDDNSAPVQSYSGKAQVFKRYKQAYDTPLYRALIAQIPQFVRLYDAIENNIPAKYKEYKTLMGQQHRFGNVRGIEKKPCKSDFLGTSNSYTISSGYIYPIFGAFRSLIRFDAQTGSIEWLFDPLSIWDDIGASLVQNTFETNTNPQLAGKDKQLWLSNYRIVETQSLRRLLREKMR